MSKIELDFAQCSTLMPMHAVISPTGHILHAGTTLKKMFPDEALDGKRFLEVFEISRPRVVSSMSELQKLTGQKLYLRTRSEPKNQLTGLAVQNAGSSNLLLNMSFGISVVDAVQTLQLTSADFAATDLAVEMLYLVEAKGLAMSEISGLNERLQGEKNEAEEQAATDTLTGLKNRRAMDHYLARYLKNGKPFTLMNMDLDYFKAVNDTLGHAAGDQVLLRVAEILREETRDEDVVARVGGDEFVLLFRGLSRVERLNDIALRLISRMEEPIPYKDKLCQISCSLGSTISEHYASPDAETLLHDADTALYASKNKGRACHTLFSDALVEMGEEEPVVRNEDDVQAKVS
jgi:diguanylate cyclase (GGDEF)-like protein